MLEPSDRGRPLIGISASLHDFGDYGGVGVPRPVLAAGGLPVTLPQLPAAIKPLLDAIDGLLLAPGRDIEPVRYSQRPDPRLAATEPQRDAFELELVTQALRRGLPVLGMCRGIRVLNVALGGHARAGPRPQLRLGHPPDRSGLAGVEAGREGVAGPGGGARAPRHPIAITPGSALALALGVTSIEVSSFHHQALDRLGEGLAVVAHAPDGLPEAVELPGRPVLAVQWELQEDWRLDERFLAVFTWFVRAAARTAAGRRREPHLVVLC